jgi:hypothetical protein
MGGIYSAFLGCTILLVINIFQNDILCQDYYSLFKSDLPADHLEFLSEYAINGQLKSDFEKFPELVYWRIKNYNSIMKDEMDSTSRDSYLFTIDYIHSRLLDRKKWIERQMALSDSINGDSEYNTPIKQYLSEKIFMLREPDNFSYRENIKDNNEINFCLYKLYSNDISLRYEPAGNYNSFVVKFERDQLNELQERYDLIESDHSHTDASFIDDLLDKWYLLLKYEDQLPPVAEIMMEYFRNKFSLYRSAAFGFSLGTSYFLNTIKINMDFNQPDVNRTYPLTTINYSKYAGLQLSYKYFLKEFLTYFSFIDISLIAQLGIKPEVPEKQSGFVDKVDIISDELFSYDQTIIDQFNLKNKSQLAFLLKATTPLLFIDYNIFLNVGFLTGIRTSSYDFELSYYYRKFERYFDNGMISYRVLRENRSELLSFSNSYSEFIIAPVCDINIILSSFAFQFTITSTDASLKAGILF